MWISQSNLGFGVWTGVGKGLIIIGCLIAENPRAELTFVFRLCDGCGFDLDLGTCICYSVTSRELIGDLCNVYLDV